MRLIVDGNSYLNAALLRGVDHDGGRKVRGEDGKDVQVNSAQYGIDGFFFKLALDLEKFSLAPRDVIVCWDGENSKARRRMHLAQYKLGRDKSPEVYEQLNIAREGVTKRMLDLGAHVVRQKGMEADDVIGYICKHSRTQRSVVCTADGDLCVLEDDNTDVWRLGEMNKQPYGIPNNFNTLYKALVGDPSDKIPGAKGFGDAKFVALVRIFGLEGLAVLQQLVETDKIDRLNEDLADFPALKLIIDSKAQVALSWRCAKLHTNDVNTLDNPWDLSAGMVKQWGEVPDDERVHELKKFYGTKTLVHGGNDQQVYDKLLARFRESPFVALDIETSTGDESDDWVARLQALTDASKERLDVLGSELTGMSLTFGDNTQHTIYMTVNHRGDDGLVNMSQEDVRAFVELIPKDKVIVIQNRSFEFSVLYRLWGEVWKDNGWHGFIPNAIDTVVGGSYVDENLPKGLKQRSLHHLGYEQASYEDTTCREGPVGTLLSGGRVVKGFAKVVEGAVFEQVPVAEYQSETPLFMEGKVLTPAVTEQWERRQYKMRELSATETFSYAADDTICTAALHTHYALVMELEQTWDTYMQVEQLPEYLTSLAFVQGIRISLQRMKELEDADDIAYDAAWLVLRDYLLTKGWAGTVCPVWSEITPAAVKEAMVLLVDTDEVQFSTRKRKLDGMALDIRAQFPDSARAGLVATMVEQNASEALSKMVKDHFTGAPKINFGSPKQLQNLFYNVIGVAPRIFNALTQKQREDDEYRETWKKKRQAKDGKEVEFTPRERELLIAKASTDDTAVNYALAKDSLGDAEREVLTAFQTIKTVQTRRSLYYKTYKAIPHWRDGRIHPAIKQSEAATRRATSSSPNVQQLDKTSGFREIILPHHKDAVIVSMDFSGQELRLLAEQSGDENLTACFVGDNLRDMHSMTAASASLAVWGKGVSYGEFLEMLVSKDPAIKAKAKALRGDGKQTNFASSYGAMAPKIAESLMVEEEVAQAFLDGKDKSFPRLNVWKDAVEKEAAERGYAVTMMGARRHLRDALQSENRWDAAKAARQASNFVIQSSAAEMTKLSMASMWKRGLFTGKYDARFLMPVHDETVISVHRDDAVALIREMHSCMVQPYGGMKIPVVSSIALGVNFGRLVEVGDQVDSDAVEAALVSLFGDYCVAG